MDLNITIRGEKELVGAIKATAEALQLLAGKQKDGTPTQTVQQAVQEMSAQQAAVQQAVQQQSVQQAAVQQQPVQQQPVQQTVQTQQITYTLDDLSKAAVTLMDLGKQQELLNLLAQFGVQSMPELKPEQYGAFALALREKGANI